VHGTRVYCTVYLLSAVLPVVLVVPDLVPANGQTTTVLSVLGSAESAPPGSLSAEITVLKVPVGTSTTCSTGWPSATFYLLTFSSKFKSSRVTPVSDSYRVLRVVRVLVTTALVLAEDSEFCTSSSTSISPKSHDWLVLSSALVVINYNRGKHFFEHNQCAFWFSFAC
jgi:hypothetical protein